MAYDLEEQEKLDALRAWWDRYGVLCVSLLALVAAALLGWRGWQWYQGNQATQAMGYFEALQTEAINSDPDAVARIKAASATLRAQFPASGYTARGVLIAGKALQDRGDLEGAREELIWLTQSGQADAALAPLAKLRLAGILLAQAQYDQALAQLADAPPAFAALVADRRGDVLYAQGKVQEARTAWQEALQAFGEQSDPSAAQILQLKIDALGGRE